MDITAVLSASLLLLALGALFSALIGFLSTKFTVERDSRLDEIESLLSGANCGTCGYADARRSPRRCIRRRRSLIASTPNNKRRINEIMGINESVGEKPRQTATAACLPRQVRLPGKRRLPPAEMSPAAGRMPHRLHRLSTCGRRPYFAIEVGENGYAEGRGHPAPRAACAYPTVPNP